MSVTIQSVLNEERLFPPPADFVKQANLSGMEAYHALYQEAERDYLGFWARMAREHLLWQTPFTQVLDESNPPFYKWYSDGRLNASYNCLDRHLETQPDKTAIIFETDDGKVSRVTYRELHRRVCVLANTLKAYGAKQGDRVLIYMPMSIEAIVAMHACARIGAIHSAVFGGLSATSVHGRIIRAGASLILTADGQLRGGRAIPLKPAVDDAIATSECDSIRNISVYRCTATTTDMQAPC